MKSRDTGWRNSAYNPGTQWRTVLGTVSNGEYIRTEGIKVRITQGKDGKSLSLSDDKKIMLLIPLEPIADKLREVLQEGAGNDLH